MGLSAPRGQPRNPGARGPSPMGPYTGETCMIARVPRTTQDRGVLSLIFAGLALVGCDVSEVGGPFEPETPPDVAPLAPVYQSPEAKARARRWAYVERVSQISRDESLSLIRIPDDRFPGFEALDVHCLLYRNEAWESVQLVCPTYVRPSLSK